MNTDWLRQNWGLVAGLVLIVPVIAAALRALVSRSAWGRLRRARRTLGVARRRHQKLVTRRTALEERVASLQKKAAHVKPRVLQEASEALEDTRSLLKIAADQVLIAENHLRKIIHNEYVPARQEQLRRKYLPGDGDDARPFSF